jgi:hypothetical protein
MDTVSIKTPRASPPTTPTVFPYANEARRTSTRDCQKYSRLSGDLELLQLKADHGWSNKSFKHLLDVLRDMLLEENQIAESVYEAKKIIYPLGIEVEKNPCMQEQLCIVLSRLCRP